MGGSSEQFEKTNVALNGHVEIYRKKVDGVTIDDLQHTLNISGAKLLGEKISELDSLKYQVSVKLTFYKASDTAVTTEPPVCFNSESIR